MKFIDKRLKEYKYIYSRIYSIDLEIELYELHNKITEKLEYIKELFIKEGLTIESAINKLNDHENFLLNRIYVDGMSTNNIANILKIHRSTVYERKRKILEKISKQLRG